MTSRPNPLFSAGTISRRSFGRGALSLAALGALAACGSTAENAASSAAASSSGPAPTTGVAGGSFPVTIEHAFGSTVIPAAPTRVVSVGLTEQDFLLSLGVVPVGVTDWYGDQPNAIWPWAEAALGSAPRPELLTDSDGIEYLKVQALKPELIVGMNAGLEQASYDQLTKLAPTLATPSEAENIYFDSWELYLDTIATALGKSAEGAALKQSIKDQFAAAAAKNPDFAGKKAILVQEAVYDGNFYAYQAGLGTEFLTNLGFEIPAELDEYVPAEGGQALIPAERIDVFNSADYIIWATESEESEKALQELPGFAELTATSIYTGAVLSGAIYFSTTLSLPYIVENLVPLLGGTV